jgi:hypothetical protein
MMSLPSDRGPGRPPDMDVRAVGVVQAQGVPALTRPRRQPLPELFRVQPEAGHHHFPVVGAADQFHGRGVDPNLPETVLLPVAQAQRPIGLSASTQAAPLTITADTKTKVYGAPLPTLTASYTAAPRVFPAPANEVLPHLPG